MSEKDWCSKWRTLKVSSLEQSSSAGHNVEKWIQAAKIYFGREKFLIFLMHSAKTKRIKVNPK